MTQTPPNLLYIVVVDDEDKPYSSRFAFSASSASSRYTRSSLQNTLQLMGCKARHAFKISQRVFEVMRNEFHATASHLTERETSKSNTLGGLFDRTDSTDTDGCLDDHDDSLTLENSQINNSVQFDLYKRLTTVFVCRENFLNVVHQALSQYKYVGPKQRNDLTLACRIRERKESFTVLLCGTSGCGKSTLSSLLGSRLGVTTVVSTDSIRHMMRSFVDEKKNPLLWSSTYHAGEHLDPVAVAKAKHKAKILAGFSHSSKGDLSDIVKFENDESKLIGEKQMAIEGFKAQSEMVIESLDRLITSWEEKRESVIIEGVHLSLNFVMGLMKKHPSIIPFMVYISNEDKHMERFAVRAQYMTLDPSKNKYVKYIRNIRAIQEYLCKRADKHLVPKVNNTNVDKSVAGIHATVFACLRRRGKGEHLYDPTTNTVPLINGEYLNQRASNSMTSKGMFQLIQRQGSSRNLMALLNTDGSVAKAWPVDSIQDNENSVLDYEKKNGTSPFLYGPLQIGKSEPVNLHFGKLGISAWPSETACSSHAGSVDGSRADGTDSGSKCYSSSSSSLCSASKEQKNHSSVSGSDLDHDDEHDADEDSSVIDDKELHDDMDGSVDEESDKSDEEYEDYIKRDEKENGYLSDNDEPCIEDKLRVEPSTTTIVEATDENQGRKILERYQDKLYDSEGLSISRSFYYPPVNSDRITRKGLLGRNRRRSLSESSTCNR